MTIVADQFAETLAAAGVKRTYGIVGDSLNGLTYALRRQGRIEWVHVRHEQAHGGIPWASRHGSVSRGSRLVFCHGGRLR
jgi:pyruvate dehydrogenase (quinone)